MEVQVMDIKRFDLSDLFAPYQAEGLSLARVVAVHRDRWELAISSTGGDRAVGLPVFATLTGRFRECALKPIDMPVVGDWVAVEAIGSSVPHESTARIAAVLPRRGLLARKRPGEVDGDAIVEQPLAANIDRAILTMGVDDDFSVRRLERYLTLVWDAGAKPIVVLTKADIADTKGIPPIEERIAAVEGVAFGTPILVTSALKGEGIEQLRMLMPTGSCSILLGSSGVGKSTLLNALVGTELQATGTVRGYDGKGRHTTTSRRFVELPWGAFLVDTPGLRELQLWEGKESLTNSFPDVEGFAARCRFSDCSHGNEPGCAVRAALETGDISEERFESWSRLRREMAYLARKTDMTAARAEKDKWKAISRFQKTLSKR